MAGQRPPPQGDRPNLHSVSRGRLGGWRVTALLIGAVAVSLAYVGKFGLPEPGAGGPSPTARPSPSAAGGAPSGPAVDMPTTVPAEPTSPGVPVPTPVTQPSAPTGSAPPPALNDRYADGIPARIDDEPVLTVDEVLRLDRARTRDVLVGGWLRDGRLRERIGRSRASALHVRGADEAFGPVVIRGRFSAQPGSERTFDAREVVWSGDLQSDSTPIEVMPLLDALAAHYAEGDPGGDPVALVLADVGLDCAVAWPRHTYAARSGPVRMALVFSSPFERLVAEAAITYSQYPVAPTAADPDCPYPVIRTSGRLRWIVDGNVMLLTRGGAESSRLARQALADARDESRRPEQGWRPVTPWRALRGLWTALPGLDIAPPAEEVFCALGLPVDSWSIRHPQLRGLAVFDSVAEREEFERATPATEVTLQRGACSSLGGHRPIEPDARWVGKENVLLLVTGDRAIDATLVAALPEAPMRIWWP